MITFLVINPAIKEILSIDQDIYEQRIRLETLYERGQLQKKVLAKFNRINEQSGFLDKILLKENQELQYITSLESIADSLNVDLKINIGQQGKNLTDNISTLPFSFSLVGRWEDILAWLDKLEALPYYTDINEFSLNAQANDIAKTSIKVSSVTYWEKP